MKHIKLTLFLICITILNLCAQDRTGSSSYITPAVDPYAHIPKFSDQEVETHVKQMVSSVVSPRLTSAVKSYIKTYTVKQREKTASMLGRMAMYFSMFEQYAREQNVPTDLKYLSIVESALNPNAESRSGAMGLWQFMPATGTEQGLKINRHVDERRDPHKSTKAAFVYLKKQYKRYGDWELALAAYNGGPGRVNRAIKRGRSKNFWKISKHLPKETRNYVPAFIGATYIGHYYDLYNIIPTPVGAELEHTALTKITKPYTFQQIAEISGTPYYIIALLNPSYKRALIPHNTSGSNLVLPQGDMVRFLNHLGRPDHQLEQMIASRVPAPAIQKPDGALLISHDVSIGEDLEEVAAQYNCSVENLVLWNKLSDKELTPGQRIMLFVQKKPTDQLKYQEIEDLKSIEQLNFERPKYSYNVPAGAIPQLESPGKFATARPLNQGDFDFYRLRRRETLMDVVTKHPDITLQGLMELNNLDRFSKVKPGRKLRIRKK